MNKFILSLAALATNASAQKMRSLEKATVSIFQAIAFACVITLPLSASVTVVNSGSYIDDESSRSFSYPFEAGNADKLILSIAMETDTPVTGVSYNGVALTHIETSRTATLGRNRGIWYLDNPYTGGVATILVSGDGINNMRQIGMGVVSVKGTEAGFDTASTGAATSLTITVSNDNSFVFACIATNKAEPPTPDAPLTELYSDRPHSMESAAGYQIAVSSGSKTYSFSGGGASPDMGVASFLASTDQGPDTAPPLLASLHPADDDPASQTDGDLIVTFNEAVERGTGAITLRLSSDDSIVEAFDVSNSGQIIVDGASLTINPSTALADGTGYYVLMDASAVKDLSGNPFAGISDKTVWNFMTAFSLDSVEGRMLYMLQQNINDPWPGISNPDSAAGVFSYTLACLYLDQNVSLANQLIVDFYTRNPIPDKSASRDDEGGYFWQHIMWRLYHDLSSGSRLTTQTRAVIEENMWNWLRTRSTLAEAQQNEWIIYDSENHDAMTKGSHLMCLLALKNSPAYGPDWAFPDGTTIDEHLTAWTEFFLRYFRARAKEGINVEIACPQYAIYTVGAYYNIMDFTESTELKTVATRFMDLYWADTVSDWVSSGVRGGAQTRVYRDGNYLKSGTGYAFHSLLWGYGWHPRQSVARTYNLITATSPYRVPDIITAIATDPDRPNFLYSSRRFGRGGPWENKNYTVVFDNGDSNLRRDTWVTPDYSMGTLTLDMNRDYIALIDQNRAMGIMFASGVNDRIMVFGKGGEDNKVFSDTSGVTREDCMIVQRDQNARSGGNATQIFISQAAWDNRVENAGWLFTQLGNAYCAVRPAGGGYTSESTGSGFYLTLGDMWAPVIIQTGQAKNYNDFTDFQNSVMANPLTYSSGTMNYTSEAGDTFTFFANSKTTPQVNGVTVDLNPAKTFDSPYLSMVHGEEIATVSYPGYQNLVLDFGTLRSLSWMPDAVAHPNNWFFSDTFGWFHSAPDQQWIYHLEHGWQFLQPNNPGFFLYDLLMASWFYVNPQNYPWMHKGGNNPGWYFYFVDARPGERWFYRASDQTFVKESSINETN